LGGWFAYATAASLLNLGGDIGSLTLLDTHANARIPRDLDCQIRMARQWRYTRRLISSYPGLIRLILQKLPDTIKTLALAPTGVKRLTLFKEIIKNLNRKHHQQTGVFLPGCNRIALLLKLPSSRKGHDPYEIIASNYEPPRLPVKVNIFTARECKREQKILWKHFATNGASLHTQLEYHHHFYNHPELLPPLARSIESILEQIEREHPARSRTS
jgi:hypothetical protein